MFQVFNKNKSEVARQTSKRLGSSLKKRNKTTSHPAFKALVALNVVGALIAAWIYFDREESRIPGIADNSVVIEEKVPERTSIVKQVSAPVVAVKEEAPVVIPAAPVVRDTPVFIPQVVKKADPLPSSPRSMKTTPEVEKLPTASTNAEKNTQSSAITETIKYTVAGPQVYFHNKPDERTRRNAFINRWNKAVLKPLDEENGFVYIVYTNHYGQTSKGWMLKKHLKPLN